MRVAIFCLVSIWLLPVGAAETPVGTPIERHMKHMLTRAGMEWRTPNPGYREGARQPVSYTLVFEMDDSRQYAIGRLGGLFADGGRRYFWDLFAFYNPVTGRVTTQQVAPNGTYVAGDSDLQDGASQIIDMFTYGIDGTTRLIRHDNRFTGKDTHESLVYERGTSGEWELTQTWKWRQVASDSEPAVREASTKSS